jgi:hypothetical protein
MISGEKLTGWQRPEGTVRLGDAVVKAPGKPLRWMRNSSLQPWRAEEHRGGYVEFVGGDRITGTVVGGQAEAWTDDMYAPTHVVIRPETSKRLYTHGTSVESVRVLPESIRRVVFRAGLGRKFQPGTVFYRDGRRVGFVGLRWREASVQLLLKDGARTVSLADVAEVHMPRTDSWKAYYRELAVLSPDCKARLIRIETTGGLVATGSESRFGAAPFFSEDVLHRANSRRRHYDKQIERLEQIEQKRREAYEKARAAYNKQIALIEAGIKRDTEAGKKAMAELKPRLEKQRKADAARYNQQRKRLEETCRKEIAANLKQVAKMPPNKRASAQRKYVTLRRSALTRALTLLKAEEGRAETRRKASLERIERDLERKLKQIASAKTRLESSRKRFESADEQQGHYSAQLQSYKALRDALPGPEGTPSTWYHMVQPAWSLDPLWVPFGAINVRWSFKPDTVPLSRVRPSETVSPAMLRWRADRNADGGLLRSGKRAAGWGFGVHAYSELSFALPQEAVSFSSKVGLDRLVESGGCVRARVFLGSTKSKPVYESSFIIGSRETVNTGTIRIAASGDERINLILQADSVGRNHPPHADPLNIRDKLDWFEPVLILDRGRLCSRVRPHIGRYARVWRDWTLNFSKQGVYAIGSWFDRSAGFERGLHLPAIRAKAQPLKLTRKMTIPPDHKWLVVDAGYADGGDMQTQAVSLRIDDKEISAEKMPVRQYWRRRTAPLVYSIEKHCGKEVKLELSQRPDGKNLYWRAISTSKAVPDAYRLKSVLEASGKGDMQVPRGLGLTLQTGRIKKSYVLEALEVVRLGGRVTFCNEVTGQLRYEYLYGVMIGCDWTGGDKTFMALKDIRWVRMVLCTKDSGVSSDAVAKLKSAKGEDFVIRVVDRTPSAWGGMSCDLTVRNRTKSDVMISRIHGWGGLSESRLLKAGSELKTHAHEGQRYEAHRLPGDYKRSKPMSRTAVNGDTVWEIK